MANGNGGNGSDAIVNELRLLRGDVTELRGEIREVRDEARQTNVRLTALETATVTGFKAVGEQLAGIRTLAIERHLELDQRLRKVETRLDDLDSDRPRRRRH